MRSKRSKKWHAGKEIRAARKLIEQGLNLPGKGRPVPPHRSGGGYAIQGRSLTSMIFDEYSDIVTDALGNLVRVPK